MLVDGSCLLDLGPDHSPSPYGLLRLLRGTRLRQLTVELLNPVRWGLSQALYFTKGGPGAVDAGGDQYNQELS